MLEPLIYKAVTSFMDDPKRTLKFACLCLKFHHSFLSNISISCCQIEAKKCPFYKGKLVSNNTPNDTMFSTLKKSAKS